jgi:hypothetical protein
MLQQAPYGQSYNVGPLPGIEVAQPTDLGATNPTGYYSVGPARPISNAEREFAQPQRPLNRPPHPSDFSSQPTQRYRRERGGPKRRGLDGRSLTRRPPQPASSSLVTDSPQRPGRLTEQVRPQSQFERRLFTTQSRQSRPEFNLTGPTRPIRTITGPLLNPLPPGASAERAEQLRRTYEAETIQSIPQRAAVLQQSFQERRRERQTFQEYQLQQRNPIYQQYQQEQRQPPASDRFDHNASIVHEQMARSDLGFATSPMMIVSGSQNYSGPQPMGPAVASAYDPVTMGSHRPPAYPASQMTRIAELRMMEKPRNKEEQEKEERAREEGKRRDEERQKRQQAWLRRRDEEERLKRQERK